jgi:hypothetical protein
MPRPALFPILVPVLAALAAALAACSSPLDTIEKAQSLHGQGRFGEAYGLLADPAAADDRAATREHYLWLLEEAKTGQDDRRAAESARGFLAASEFADRLDREWDQTSVAEELGAAAVNQTVRTFRGSYADRIQTENQRAIANLLAGDLAAAGIAVRRAIERQKDAEVDHAKRIEAVRKEIESRDGTAAVKQALRSQGVDLDAASGLVLNPETSFLDWLVQSASGDGNDRQRADTSLRRAVAMAPGCTSLPRLLERNPYDAAREGFPQVVVIFETGSGPWFEQITIPIVTPWLGLTAIPLPVFKSAPPPAAALVIATPDGPVRTETLADLNAIWKGDFDGQLPELILRTAVSVAAKEAATYAAYEAAQSIVAAQIGVLVAASVYKAAVAQADLRTWRSIPAAVQVAAVPRPPDGVLELREEGGANSAIRVELPPGGVVLAWVRSVGTAPPVAATAVLMPPLLAQ